MSDIEKINANEVDIFGKDNPRSLHNLTSGIPTLHEAIDHISHTNPELLELEETELRQKANPTFTLSRLRISFWNEYENAIQNNRKMVLSKILAGVCNDTVFYKKILPDPSKLAFLLTPPKDYIVTIKEALDAGLDNVRAIVSANPFKPDGKTLDPKIADTVLKAYLILEMRVKGAVIQRIDQRSVNLNVNKDVTPPGSHQPQSLEEMERELDQLREKMARPLLQARLPTAPKDIVDTMKECNVELVDTGGDFRVKK